MVEMKITLKQLRLIGACEPQVELFKATFGTEVELTEANAVQYGALFDISWLANKLLKGDKLADYRAKRDPLNADYRAKCDPLDADYRAKCDPLECRLSSEARSVGCRLSSEARSVVCRL
jgi:hypothetical protein